jgi:predicted SAM-dependent methyltransferase
MADWWNVDVRGFRGIDEVADVTAAWPWRDLDYVYGEHFLEHLGPDDALTFLSEAIVHLRPRGRIRLSTPSLEFVWQTHFTRSAPDAAVVSDTYRANRAFHGWGHQFLYSRPFLERILRATGFVDVEFFAFGESHDAELSGLERHGKPVEVGGWPSVWNVEAARPPGEPAIDPTLREEIDHEFERYVRQGH